MKRHYIASAALSGMLLMACAILPSIAEAANVYVGGHITANTTWLSTNTYIATSTVTIDSGAKLTIQAGTTVDIAPTRTALIVSGGGVLVAEGTPASKITFTSTSNNPGAWKDIEVQTNASSTISNASVKYGGSNNAGNVYNSGGILTLDTVDIATSVYYSVYQGSGTSTILNSTLHGQPGWYGFYETGGVMNTVSSTISGNGTGFYSSGNLTLTGNKFANSGWAGWMSFANNASFNPSSSTSTGNEWHGFYTDGTTYGSQTLPGGDLPYVIAGLTVTSNSTLTLGKGAMVKFYPLKNLTVANNGVLKVQGTSASSVYFTSIYDNSVYNNTLTSTTSAKPGDWDTIALNSGASSTISYAYMRYGGYTAGTGLGGTVYSNGGTLTLDTVDVATSSYYGVYQATGTCTVLNSTLHGQTALYGIALINGPMTVASSNFLNNNTGIYSTALLSG